MSLPYNPNTLQYEWKDNLDEDPPVPRTQGFQDAVRPELSWKNTYEINSKKWEEYSKGYTEGKRLIKKKTGKKARKRAFVDLLSFTPHHTPESEYYDVNEDDAFLSESYLYALLGKEDGRTVLNFIKRLIDSYDLDYHKIKKDVVQESN